MTATVTMEQLQEAYKTLRARAFYLHDLVEVRMGVERTLQREVEEAVEEVTNLQNAIDAIAKVNGDASMFKAQYETQKARLNRAHKELGAIEEELSYLRAVMKHMDNAYESIHCGMMYEHHLERFYREQKSA